MDKNYEESIKEYEKGDTEPIENPFEDLSRINFPPLSFDIFESIYKKKENEQFRWSIEQIAEIDPVDIELTNRHKIIDYSTYKEIQYKVDQYFSSLALPSPWTPARRVILPEDYACREIPSSPTYFEDTEECMTSASYQTDISFNPNFDLKNLLISSDLKENHTALPKPIVSLTDSNQINVDLSKKFDCYANQITPCFSVSPAILRQKPLKNMTCSNFTTPVAFPDFLSPVASASSTQLAPNSDTSE